MIHKLSFRWLGAPAGEVGESMRELQENTFRILILVFSLFFLIWLFDIGLSLPDLVQQAFPIALFLIGSSLLVNYLSRIYIFAAQVIWQIGAGTVILLFIVQFNNPIHAIFMILLPFMAAIVGGWQMLIVSEFLIVGLLLVGFQGIEESVYSTMVQQSVIRACFIAGVIGWVASRSLLTLAQWSYYRYQQAAKSLREAQEQRMELMQVQEDLIQANRELARMSDRLRTLTQYAEDARRIKEEFVANVSHELRTPLNMIIGFSEVILKSPHTYKTRLPESLLADVAAIQRNSQHLVGLVNDVLALSQVESGKLVLSREWGSLRSILEEAREAVSYLFQSKKLNFEFDFPGDDITVFCDRLRIREVVLNLLSNAGRFTEKGGVTLFVRRLEGDVIIGVRDTGSGIAEKDIKRIFEPFQQLDSTLKRKQEGSGLGLSISKRFVEMHDGRMWVESEEQKGSTFYFSLPLEPKVETEAQVAKTLRWINRYQPYQPRQRLSKAPSPTLFPRYIIFEKGYRLYSYMKQWMQGVDVQLVQGIDDLMMEVKRSPATAVIVNTSDTQELITQIHQAGGLPFDTPLFVCWVPGQSDAAHHLGVIQYLVKPVTQVDLIRALKQIGEDIRSILVVDDNPEAIQLFSRILSAVEPPYQVLRAMGGVQALELMRQRKPHAVILDLVMPDMDGFQVLKEKANDPEICAIPVIIVSSLDPLGSVVISNMFSVSRGNGITTEELLTCFEAVSSVLSPRASLSGSTPPVNQPV